jgi:hypothetical protein
MPYDVCSSIITCNYILGGGSRMLLGDCGDHGGYNPLHNQQRNAILGDYAVNHVWIVTIMQLP